MTPYVKSNRYWTKERCMEEALKYETKKEWRENSNSSYNITKKNGWFYECTSHMIPYVKSNRYWTKERCIKEVLKYETKKEWRENSAGSYGAAKKNMWLDECTSHMTPHVKPNGYWTKERCMEEALKYDFKVDWKKNSGSSYSLARRYGWFDECIAHMKKK